MVPTKVCEFWGSVAIGFRHPLSGVVTIMLMREAVGETE
jgi:hypothetical protein